MAHANSMTKHHQERTPSTKEELRQRLPIDLFVFQLMDTFESLTDFDPNNYHLRLLDLPPHTATVAAVTDALEQDPEAALITLDRVMGAVDGYMAICELEGCPDDEARLQVCWDQLDELLASASRTVECGSRMDNQDAVRAGNMGLAA